MSSRGVSGVEGLVGGLVCLVRRETEDVLETRRDCF